MKQLVGKILMILACTIILVHAVVPHHHHDVCCASGMIFENELTCHEYGTTSCACSHENGSCSHDHHDMSHHPFNRCKLQDLLSQLVLSHNDEKILQLTLHPNQVPVLLFGALFVMNGMSIDISPIEVGSFNRMEARIVALTGVNYAPSISHRGPPQIA